MSYPATVLSASGTDSGNINLQRTQAGASSAVPALEGPTSCDHPVSHSLKLVQGDVTGGATQVFEDQITIAGSGTATRQLSSSGSLKDVFGQAIAWTKLKEVFVQNLGPGVLTVQKTGASLPIPIGTDIKVNPGGMLHIIQNAAALQLDGVTANTDTAGIAIGAGATDKISLDADGSGCTVNLRVAGVGPLA